MRSQVSPIESVFIWGVFISADCHESPLEQKRPLGGLCGGRENDNEFPRGRSSQPHNPPSGLNKKTPFMLSRPFFTLPKVYQILKRCQGKSIGFFLRCFLVCRSMAICTSGILALQSLAQPIGDCIDSISTYWASLSALLCSSKTSSYSLPLVYPHRIWMSRTFFCSGGG